MRKKQGFTLSELLIVVAIIAVLVAIAIPIFTTQLEKSKEAADIANVRAAYAEIMVAAAGEELDPATCTYEDGLYYKEVELTQGKRDWQRDLPLEIGGVMSTDSAHWKGKPDKGTNCLIEYNKEDNACTFYWGEGQHSNVSVMTPSARLNKGGNKVGITVPRDTTIEVTVHNGNNGNGAAQEAQTFKLKGGQTNEINVQSEVNNSSMSIKVIGSDLTQDEINEIISSVVIR